MPLIVRRFQWTEIDAGDCWAFLPVTGGYKQLLEVDKPWTTLKPGVRSEQTRSLGVLPVGNRFPVSTGANNPWFSLARPGTTLTKTDVVGLGERNRFQVSAGANSP